MRSDEVLSPEALAASDIRLGVSHEQAGNLQAAVQCYQQALALDTTAYAAYNNLGNIFACLGDCGTALTFLQAAVTLNPNAAEIHNNIGNLFFEQEDTPAAIVSYRRAIALLPETASYSNHLGNALRADEQYAEAEVCLLKALALQPRYPEAHVNLGFLYLEREQVEQAERAYRQAVQMQPDYALAHLCLARILLRRGDFAAGWAEQEWRWKWKDFPSPPRNFAQSQWKGEAVGGSRLFLHAEQGFGDTLQFLRYVPLVAEQLAGTGATIVLEVHPELKSLVADMPGVSKIIARGEAVPAFDWHCPLMSLPLVFSTTLLTIPPCVSYLQSPPRNQQRSLRVGLVWAGSQANRADRKRSIALAVLSPLFKVEGVAVYSLQRGLASAEAANMPFAGSLSATGDFADTAEFLSELDLVITVDTAVAHLAGALGKPVWILLPKIADWRWLMERKDSPWYPRARLLRQEVAGDWGPVIGRVAAELSLMSRGKGTKKSFDHAAL